MARTAERAIVIAHDGRPGGRTLVRVTISRPGASARELDRAADRFAEDVAGAVDRVLSKKRRS